MVTLQIEKKHLYALSLALGVVIGVLVVNAVTPAFSSSRPWHPLQQVTITGDGSSSVDADHNGVIDNADRLGGRSPSAYQSDVFGSCTDGQYMKTVADNGGVTCSALLITGSYSRLSQTTNVNVPGITSTNPPRAVEIFSEGAHYFKSDDMTGSNCYRDSDSNRITDNCITFTAAGFSVHDPNGPNQQFEVYYYTVWQ